MNERKFIFLIPIFISLLNLISTEYTSIKSLPNKKKGFQSFSLGLSQNCKPLYYTDINNDKYIDIIASCKEGTTSTISYYIYNEDKGNFQLATINGTESVSFENSEIINFIANDLNFDSYLDYIITLKETKSKTYTTYIFIFNNSTMKYEKKYIIEDSDMNIFTGAIGNDRKLKVIFYDKKEKKRKVISFDISGNPLINDFSNYISSNTNICSGNEKYKNYPFISPNSNGFVDIDGDCLNDIMILSYDNSLKKNILEIWKGVYENKEIKYCLTLTNVYELDNSLGLPTLVDVDRNALIDIVFPIKESSPPKILIAYNIIEMSYTWTSDYCDDHKPISLSEKSTINKIFDDIVINSNNNNVHTITIYNDNDYTFYNEDYFPLFLKFIDINQDSYPDFITILKNKKTKTNLPIVFLSQKILYDDNFKGEIRRTYSKSEIYSFEEYTNIISVSFFDFGDNGKMDLLFIDSNINSIGLYNQNLYDSYTMKSILLFNSNCFYCYEFGSTQRFITTNIDGTRRMDLSIQFSQNTISALNLPFAYLGIGRSNNYIENFQIISGNKYKSSDNVKTYTPVIPNSQLVIFHTNSGKDSTSWKVDLVVKPTKYLYQLIIVIILMIAFGTFLASYLEMKEREEDNEENKETFAPWFG